MEGPPLTSLPSIEAQKEIILSQVTPEDYAGVLNVQYKAALKNYPNEELGITTEDIEADYAEARTEEKIKEKEEHWRDLPANPNQQYLVAKSEGNVVGFCVVDKYEDRNQLSGIYIAPEFQGKGLGKKFWEQAMTFIDSSKDTVVMFLPYNTQAIGYYRSLGFEKTGVVGNNGIGSKMKSGAIMPGPIEMLRKAKW